MDMGRMAVALAIAWLPAGAAPDAPSADRGSFARPRPAPREGRDGPATDAAARLGRRLFFDTRLSGDGSLSCAGCHRPDAGWTDGNPKAVGAGPLPVRTPTLNNLAWQGRMGWDGKFPTVEAVTFGPITGAGNMNLPESEAIARLSAAPGYGEAFAAAFGSPGVTRPRVEAALGAFVRGLVTPYSAFDRFVAGDAAALTPEAARGFALFAGKANCAACHSGWSLSDGSFHDVGLPDADPGRGRLFPASAALAHAHKTPSLRGVALRGPYMHDGSLRTLEDVVAFYDGGHATRPSLDPEMRAPHLTRAERDDLAAFLRALDETTPDPFADAPPASSEASR